MRKLMFITRFILLLATIHVSVTCAAERIAVVEDSQGVVSEVQRLCFSADFSKFDINSTDNRYFGKPCIGVDTKALQLAIPFSSIESISAKQNHVIITYNINGRVRKIEADFLKGVFAGTTSLGHFELPSEKLRNLSFKTPPDNSQAKIPSFDTTLVLADGSQMHVMDVKRVSWSNDSMYIGRRLYFNYRSIDIFRGDSETRIEFSKIKRITLQSPQNVSIILKDGSTVNGRFEKKENVEVVGFSGANEDGEFFIAADKVKAIEL
jgi:hypothetical protein